MSENNENSAKNGSGYVIKFKPESLDSLDARILQYKYALVKLKHLIDAIDGIIIEAKENPANLVLIHYIIHLSSNLFAISDTGFFPKVEHLEGYKVPKSLSVASSQVVRHVPYDMKDQPVGPLFELPATKTSISCLKAFRTLCTTCLDAYQKRYTNASREIENEAFLSDLEFLFSESFFDPAKDFDLTLQSVLFKQAALVFRLDPTLSSSEDYSEASLIDIDICSLFTIVSETARILDAQKSSIHKYKSIKSSPTTLHERQLKEQPHSAYALHRVFFWALRMNELYFILRKFGRQVFISNREHLDDEKFISFVSNSSHYRSLLQEIKENLFHTKKNGVLIATITRFLRLDSKHEISAKTVFEFVGFIAQSVVYMESLISLLKNFGHIWIDSEIAFRKSHDLPLEYLLNLNDIIEEEKVKELKAKRLRAQAIAKQKSKVTAPPALRTLVKRQSSPVTSNGDSRVNKSAENIKKDTDIKEKPDTKAAPISNGPAVAKSPFYLQKQSSSSSLQSATSTSSADKVAPLPSPIATRRRANSQPISFNAAASALKASNGANSPVRQDYIARSPTGSIRRSSSLTRKPPSASISSPLSNKLLAMEVVEETKETPSKTEVKRTASQKFQQHLMEAARSGALYGKEKEKLSNVVFDPNNPSATNLRRQPKQAPPVGVPVEEEVSLQNLNIAPSQSSVNDRPTRAQVTKINTRRNSVVVQADNASRLSDVSRHSMISASSQSSTSESIVTKKVRFTGVPEYTPAEDAPESQKSKILKSFAALKIPTVRNSGVKRKDEAFKKEESQLFKQGPTQEASQSDIGNLAPEPQALSKLSRFRNRF